MAAELRRALGGRAGPGPGLRALCFTCPRGLPCQQPPGRGKPPCGSAGRGWAHGAGGPAGQPCVCAAAAPAGLGSWLRTSSQTAPQSSGSPAGRLSPEGWRAGQGPGGSRVGWGRGVTRQRREQWGSQGGSLVRGEAAREIGAGDNWGEGSRVSKWTMAQDLGYPYC